MAYFLAVPQREGMPTSENEERTTGESKERKHGGGWPKGKSRKPPNEALLPKLPMTGYCCNYSVCIELVLFWVGIPFIHPRIEQ